MSIVSVNTHTVSIKYEFAAGHQLSLHQGKCRSPHGHNYQVQVDVDADWDKNTGMILDLDALHAIVCGWINKNWDHAFLWNRNTCKEHIEYFKKNDWKVFEFDGEPTCESMAAFLANELMLPLSADCSYLRSLRVEIHEMSHASSVYKVDLAQ